MNTIAQLYFKFNECRPEDREEITKMIEDLCGPYTAEELNTAAWHIEKEWRSAGYENQEPITRYISGVLAAVCYRYSTEEV